MLKYGWKQLCILVTVALAAGAACSGGADGVDGADGRSPLVLTAQEPAGENCEFGGTLIRSGFDGNGDGSLSESEIVETTYICNGAAGQSGQGGAPGEPGEAGQSHLLRIDEVEAGEDCLHGGRLIHGGFDVDGDGVLGDEEILTSTLVCDPVPGFCSGREALQLEGYELEQDPFNAYEVGRSYEMTLRFNQEVDESLSVVVLNGDGLSSFEPSADDVQAVQGTWWPTFGSGYLLLGSPGDADAFSVLATDGCTITTGSYTLPRAQDMQPQVALTATPNGIMNPGDDVEVCWRTRRVESCTLYFFDNDVDLTFDDEEIDFEGCKTFNPVSEGYVEMVCTGPAPWGGTQTRSDDIYLPQGPALIDFWLEDNPYVATGPATFDFGWDTFGMEKCELILDGVAQEVPTGRVGGYDPYYSVVLTETTRVEFRCEDAEGNVYTESPLNVVIGKGILGIWGYFYADFVGGEYNGGFFEAYFEQVGLSECMATVTNGSFTREWQPFTGSSLEFTATAEEISLDEPTTVSLVCVDDSEIHSWSVEARYEVY